MSAYAHLCSLTAHHEFHAGGPSAELAFVPSEETQRHLQRERLMLRESPGSVHVIGEPPRGEEEDVVLRFGVVAKDKDFGLYTQMPPSAEGEGISVGAAPGPHRFKTGRGIGAWAKPLAIVDIELAKLRRAKRRPCAYALRFAARQTYWKYFFVGDAAPQNAVIVDPENGIRFERSEAEFYNGLRATVFLSEIPIPMRDVPPQRFQLWAGDRVVYARLPNASLERMGTHAGSDMLVSEIYVNR